MLKSRWIDRGNPVKCPRCQATSTVPDPEAIKATLTAQAEHKLAKPLVTLGFAFLLGGIAVTVLSMVELPGAPTGAKSAVYCYGAVLAGIGLILTNWRNYRANARRASSQAKSRATVRTR